MSGVRNGSPGESDKSDGRAQIEEGSAYKSYWSKDTKVKMEPAKQKVK